MTTREEALSAALQLPGAYLDTPFHDDNWVVARRGNRRIFLAAFERQGKIWLNVKVRPDWPQILCASFEAVVPAYHMNKRHWISIILDGTMEDDEIVRLIEESYDLTEKKPASEKRGRETNGSKAIDKKEEKRHGTVCMGRHAHAEKS